MTKSGALVGWMAAVGIATLGGSAARADWTGDYSDCEKKGFSSHEFEEIGAAYLGAMKQCEQKIIDRVMPQLQRVLAARGMESLVADQPMACTQVGGLADPSYVNFQVGYKQQLTATAGGRTAKLDFTPFYFSGLTTHTTRVMKGEVVDPLGNVVTPGTPTDVIERKLETRLSFRLVNPVSQRLVIDATELYGILLREFSAGGPYLGDILECSADFPKEERPVEP